MDSEKQWELPQLPKIVKVRTAQRVRSAEEGSKYFAVRYILEEPSTTKIKESGRVVPAPEFGAMLYNFEIYTGKAIFESELKKPIDKDGIRAKFRAEVWKTQDDQPKVLSEIWFASELPKPISFNKFISEVLNAEQKQQQAELRKISPKPVESLKRISRAEEEVRIDHGRNVREVCERLLRREYPQTYKALDRKADNNEVRKAFVADNIANVGSVPDVENFEGLFRGSQFIDYLFKAGQKRGHKVPPEEWTLAIGWVKWGFCGMNNHDLEKALNEKTGLKLKGASWRRRAQRLGLISARKPGRPEKPNLLPPSQ